MMQDVIQRNEFYLEVEDIELFKEKILAQANVYEDFIFLDSNCEYNKNSSYDFIAAFSSKSKYCGSDIGEFKEFLSNQKEYAFGSFCYDLKDEVFNLSSLKNQFIPFSKISFFIPNIIIFCVNKIVKASLTNEISKEDFNLILNTELVYEEKSTLFLQAFNDLNWGEYQTKFEKIKRHIQRGDIYEVNLCSQIKGKKVIKPIDTFKKLNSISSAPYAAMYRQNNSWLLSSSPELFLEKKGDMVTTKPIKGTSPRNINKEFDLQNKKNLVASEKERNENVMIVDLARNDLSTIAQRNSVEVKKLFDVETYKQVHHLVSTIECKMKKEIHTIDAIKNTFPMASMTGVPKKRALEIIEEIEGFNRGLYSGSLGFFDPNDNFIFNVVIRSILYNQKTNEVSFSVGSAITDKCNARDEFAECMLKAKAMIEVLEM